MNFLGRIRAFIVVLIIAVQLLAPFSVARAQLVTHDPASFGAQLVNTIQSIWQVTKDVGLDKVVFRVASTFLNNVADSIVGWVNGGFEGQPSFIANFGEFSTYVARTSAISFIDDLIKTAEKQDQESYTAEEAQYKLKCENAKERLKDWRSDMKDIIETQAFAASEGYDAYMQKFLQIKGFATFEEYLDDYVIENMTPDEQAACLKSSQLSKSYSADVIKYLGVAYFLATEDPTIKLTTPNIPQELAAGWGRYPNSFEDGGGWQSWDYMTDLRNTFYGNQLLARKEIHLRINSNLEETARQLQVNSGFTDKGKCVEPVTLSDGTTPYCHKYVASTPGDVVRNMVNESLTAPMRKVEQADELGEILNGALGRLVNGLTEVGLSKLNDGIGDALNRMAQSSSPGSQNSNVQSSNPILNPSQGTGWASAPDETIDVLTFLYGDPVREVGPNGDPVYYPQVDANGAPLTDADGRIIPDISRPKYVHDINNSTGTVGYELNNGGEIIYDVQSQPIIKYVRENGAQELVFKLIQIYQKEQELVRTQLTRKLMDLDHTLPGPDVGWDVRLAELTNNRLNDMGQKEIFEETKAKMNQGYYQSIQSDITDIELTHADPAKPARRVDWWYYKFDTAVFSPQTKSFELADLIREMGTSFKFPGILLVNSTPTEPSVTPVGAIISEPDGSTLVSRGLTAGFYRVANLNTFAGVWHNPETKTHEVITNIPTSLEARAYVDYAIKTYKTIFENATRRLADLRAIQNKLATLDSEYRSMPNVPPNVTDPDEYLRLQRARKEAEDKLAYNISLVKDEVPLLQELDREQANLNQILDDKDEMGALMSKMKIEIAGVGKAENQKDKYFNLYFKDALGVLYCPLQDHRYINEAPLDIKIRILKRLRPSGTGLSIDQLAVLASGDYGNKLKNLKPISENAEILTRKTMPFRCYETTIICSKDAGCRKNACNNRKDYGEEDTFLEHLPLRCSRFYRSDLADYHQLITKLNY